MPIQIDRSKAHDLTPRWDEALELVRNEFEGLDPHRQYRNAFARLLKPDTSRVSKMFLVGNEIGRQNPSLSGRLKKQWPARRDRADLQAMPTHSNMAV
jgi:hypothetical protein